MQKNPIFTLVAIKAGNCGACTRFKATEQVSAYAAIRKEFPYVDIIDFELPSMNTPPSAMSQFPVDINRYRSWYPMFIIMPFDTWNNAMINKNAHLNNVSIFNGKLTNDKLEMVASYPMNAEGLIKWIRSIVGEKNEKSIPSLYSEDLSRLSKTDGCKSTGVIPRSCASMLSMRKK